jgi:hypothetical protein
MIVCVYGTPHPEKRKNSETLWTCQVSDDGPKRQDMSFQNTPCNEAQQDKAASNKRQFFVLNVQPALRCSSLDSNL